MANFPNFESQYEILSYYLQNITKSNYDEIVSLAYKFIKNITEEYYIDGKMAGKYSLLKNRINNLEKRFAFTTKILPCEPIIIVLGEEKDKEDFIRYLVDSARIHLIKNSYHYSVRKNEFDFSKLHLTNFCVMASDFISDFCKIHNVECYKIPICPGYNKDAKLFNGVRWHYANVVKYNNEYYLVDLTISQFFYKFKNNLDRLGVIGCDGCYPGVFMLLTEKGKNIVTTLLNEGYIKLDEATFKAYMDAFTISFRNGLYYEDTNDFSYTTNYSTDDYIRFLNGEDDQIKHEGRENLGYQKRPLKNSSLEFRR